MQNLPTLLMFAWLLPLVSFAVICVGYSVPQLFGSRARYSTQVYASYISIGAIVGAFVLSFIALFFCWLPAHPLGEEHAAEKEGENVAASDSPFHYAAMQTDEHSGEAASAGH